jgi:16S rRNA (uracil1498-N3)-methyltransferase
MNLPLFYQQNLDLHSSIFELDEDASRHVIQVLRMQKGERIQLTDGKGSMMVAEIEEGHKKSCTVRKISLEYKLPSERRITIAISPVKNTSRFEWFLEKATEMGVYAIIPLICKRTEKQHFRKDRMQSILTSAMLQSKQAFLPLLFEATVFAQVFTNANQKIKCIAHCEEGKEKNPFRSICNNEDVFILIGPEGDFTTEEIEMAVNQNFIPVSLGETRLRTETAGVAAAALFCI